MSRFLWFNVYSALEVFSRNALYKFTFYIYITYKLIHITDAKCNQQPEPFFQYSKGRVGNSLNVLGQHVTNYEGSCISTAEYGIPRCTCKHVVISDGNFTLSKYD